MPLDPTAAARGQSRHGGPYEHWPLRWRSTGVGPMTATDEQPRPGGPKRCSLAVLDARAGFALARDRPNCFLPMRRWPCPVFRSPPAAPGICCPTRLSSSATRIGSRRCIRRLPCARRSPTRSRYCPSCRLSIQENFAGLELPAAARLGYFAAVARPIAAWLSSTRLVRFPCAALIRTHAILRPV